MMRRMPEASHLLQISGHVYPDSNTRGAEDETYSAVKAFPSGIRQSELVLRRIPLPDTYVDIAEANLARKGGTESADYLHFCSCIAVTQ